jgi:AcrR family transcriptional regulator
MGRPQTITDEEVLAAARAVFLDKGITATVEEVAARCGVGEATVFRRFPTKAALFVAAVDSTAEPDWERILEELWPASRRRGSEDVHGTLTALANEMLAFGRKMYPLLQMKLTNPTFFQQEKPPRRVTKTLEMLTEFFDFQIRAGRVRGKNPRVTARLWLGGLQHLIFLESFVKPMRDVTPPEYIEGLVDLFCDPERPAKGRKPK